MRVIHLVESAVKTSWPEFQQRHPALAAELTREEYVTASMQTLRQDPNYKVAVRKGEVIAGLEETLSGLVEKTVKGLMRI